MCIVYLNFKILEPVFPTPHAGPFFISGLWQVALVAASLTVPWGASNLSARKGLLCKLNPSRHALSR